MLPRTRLFTVGLLALGLTGAIFLTASPSLPAKGEPAPGPLIHLVRATFDPLAGPPDLPHDLTLRSYPSGTSGAYLVQFDGPLQAGWKDDLRHLGVQLFDYIPDYTFLAWMDGATAARVADHPHVRWVGLYQPAYRLSPRLDGAAGKGAITLLTFPTTDEAALRVQLEALGATIHDVVFNESSGYFRLTVDAAQLPALVRLPPVTWVEPYLPPRLLNDVARGDGIMNAAAVWQDLGLYGEGQIVGVCDTGLDVGVDDATLNADFEGRVVSLYDWDGWPLDDASDRCSGHGTHVAGTVLGNGANSGSDPANHDYTTSYAGLAPKAQLVFQAFEWALDPPDLCLLFGLPSDLSILFQQAYDDGARIHTNSWGVEVNGQYTTLSQQTDQFAWNHKDFTILFAAGNSGADANSDGVVDLDSLISPGTAKNCITVGGSENDRPTPSPNADSGTYGGYWPDDYPAEPISSDPTADAPGGMAAFSSRGPTDDGRMKPDLIAPATWVLSVYSQANHPEAGGSQDDGWGNPPSRWYKYMGGTSMATPLTAGAAALVRDYFNDVAGLVTPSSALVKATLINGAYDTTPGQYGSGPYQEIPGRPNNVQGWGRVDLANSLIPGAPRGWWYDDHNAGLSTDDTVTYTSSLTTPLVVMDGSEPLRVSLVWTDYPGTPAAGGGLVNDLDLEVIGPGSTHYYGNGTAGDRVNNVEGVDILAPTLGVYTVTVHAHNVATAPQPYALVVSGALADPTCVPLTGVALQTSGQASVGERVPFTATVAPPTVTLPIHYSWAFGDGLSHSGMAFTAQHVYRAPGLYTTVVTATNCVWSGLVTDTLQVSVQDTCQPPLNVGFLWGPQPVFVGAVTAFTASVGEGTPPLTYTWRFGDDGSQATERNGLVSHTFSVSGTFPVTLTVANACDTAAPVVHPVSVSRLTDKFLYLPLILKRP